MNCRSCGMEMVERRATTGTPYAYTLSGLKGVFLEGISVFQCKACGEEVPIIPKLGELHHLIALSLFKKEGLLTGSELKFLRKNAGFQAIEFAALMGVSPTYLSKAENGKCPLGPGADKLARMLSAVDEKMRGLLIEIAKDLKPSKKRSTKKPIFRLERSHWLQAVA